MPKKSFLFSIIFIFLVFNFSLFFSSFTWAQELSPTTVPTCDLCGWCNREINPKPPHWDDCMQCLYAPDGTPRERTYYTVLGCFSTDPAAAPFVKSLLSIIFGIAGGLAFLAVLYGSSLVLTSSGDPLKLSQGKEVIISSLFGIFLILFSVFLLRVVGVDILGLPGFG